MTVESFGAARANKENDCRLQTVVECLEAALDEARETTSPMKDGRWNKCLLIFHEYDEETKRFKVDLRCSGVTTLEARGLMVSWMREDFLEELL